MLEILIVSDEANPHGLTPAELTQPGEISAALLDPGSGLNLDAGPYVAGRNFQILANAILWSTGTIWFFRVEP